MPSRDNSAVGRILVPNLFLSRWILMLLVSEEGRGAPGGRKMGRRNGMRKRDSPREPESGGPVRARARAISLSVALENHLNPFSQYTGPYGLVACGMGVATVSVWETSEPPGRWEAL